MRSARDPRVIRTRSARDPHEIRARSARDPREIRGGMRERAQRSPPHLAGRQACSDRGRAEDMHAVRGAGAPRVLQPRVAARVAAKDDAPQNGCQYDAVSALQQNASGAHSQQPANAPTPMPPPGHLQARICTGAFCEGTFGRGHLQRTFGRGHLGGGGRPKGRLQGHNCSR